MAVEISKNFDSYNKEISSFETQVKKAEFQVLDLKNTFKKVQSAQLDTEREIRNINLDLEKHKKIVNKLELESVAQHQYSKDIEEVKISIDQLRYGLSDLNSNLQTTDNYLDKYLCFRMQNLISETLDNVLDEYQLGRLTKYEKYKYKKMHDDVLNDEGKPQFDKTITGVKVYHVQGKHLFMAR
jgi:chromosome segregation ATPase